MRDGRDKLTVVLPPSLASLGLWIEQLVAESTGKHGKGALPVVDEPLGRPDEYGSDRAFVAITTDRDAPDEARLAALEAAGHPVLRLSTRIDGLGAEFFRWEFATAVAGAVLGINPFDEPNVSEAKEKTKGSSAARSRRRPSARHGGIGLVQGHQRLLTHVHGEFAGRGRARRTRVARAERLRGVSFVPARDERSKSPSPRFGRPSARKHHVASTFGVGPRYLHSTGQYHKGGPNTASRSSS